MLNTVAKTFTAIDPWLEWLGDRLNPLLVKETRQAMKSRQFTLWFVLMLIASWLITIGGVAIIGPSISFVSAGGYLLLAYFFALAVPLVIVVPFTAYRSLASELEDNTRDLLEVSTLSPYQIINGKLGSAVVQMLVYLSVLAPCLAFTYLLARCRSPDHRAAAEHGGEHIARALADWTAVRRGHEAKIRASGAFDHSRRGAVSRAVGITA